MKRTIALVGAVTAALGGLVLTAPQAEAAVCSGPHVIRTSGGLLSYHECNGNGQSQVYGYVKDTDADGQCAYAKVQIGTWTKSWRACREGAAVNFDSGWHKGGDAKVWLSEH